VLFGAFDPRLTGHAGVAAVTEADRVLGIVDALDGAVGPIKERDRGLTAGALLLSMASAQLTCRCSRYVAHFGRIIWLTCGGSLTAHPGGSG
jgi:hypothetical protein